VLSSPASEVRQIAAELGIPALPNSIGRGRAIAVYEAQVLHLSRVLRSVHWDGSGATRTREERAERACPWAGSLRAHVLTIVCYEAWTAGEPRD